MGMKGTRGILNPGEGLSRFVLAHELPPDDLAHFVECFWSVSWDLEGQAPFAQEILPYPCVNISFGPGSFEVHGPNTRRFVAHLTGRGRVYAVKFTPAGFSAFAGVPLRSLVDRVVSIEEATCRTSPVPENDDPITVRTTLEAFLRSFAPTRDETTALVDNLVEIAQNNRDIARAEDLASAAGISVRSLQRLFERHVGVGPKWIVRRARVQEAAERVARGEKVDWAATAQELGFHDQAHLIRDFRSQVGFTPGAYARRCAASAAARSAEVNSSISPSRPT